MCVGWKGATLFIRALTGSTIRYVSTGHRTPQHLALRQYRTSHHGTTAPYATLVPHIPASVPDSA
eukprot:2548252-Rhodomonas_salina.1